MEVRHCPNSHCNDGKVVDYGSPHDPVIDCPECNGTGHIVIPSVQLMSYDEVDKMFHVPDIDDSPEWLLNVNPKVGLHDKDTCDGYIEGTCEDDPCPDCELAYGTQENE